MRRVREGFRVFAYLFLAVAFMAAGVHAQSGRVTPTPTPTPDPDAPERVTTEEIKLNVLAFDPDGKFVPDVKGADLVITENDILHQAASVRRIPANVLVVMDTGGEMRSMKSLEQTKKVARAVVSSLRDGDSIAILNYSDKAEIAAPWSTDKQAILHEIGRAKFGREDAFTDALRLSRDYMMRGGSRDNKHIVLITDGTDGLRGREARYQEMQRMLGTDINVHVISYTSMEIADITPRTKATSNKPPPKAMPDEVAATLPNGTRDVATAPKIGPTINLDRSMLKTLRARKADLQTAQEQLQKLAENTNGEFILPDTLDEMVDKAPRIASVIDASYVVTYVPKVPLDEGSRERNIEVTSKRAGLVVHARRKLVLPRR